MQCACLANHERDVARNTLFRGAKAICHYVNDFSTVRGAIRGDISGDVISDSIVHVN